MTATTVNDSAFNNFPLAPPSDGSFPIPFNVSVPDTSLDEANDRFNIVEIQAGKKITRVDILYNGAGDAHATPQLDADLVLSEEGLASASGTETVLYNAGTRFQAASTLPVSIDISDETVADSVDSKGVVRLLVNTGAATAATLQIIGIIWIK